MNVKQMTKTNIKQTHQTEQSKSQMTSKQIFQSVEKIKKNKNQISQNLILNIIDNQYLWQQYLIVDVDFIIQKIDKSVLKIIDGNIKKQLVLLTNKIKGKDGISKEYYYNCMNIVNNMLRDDHSHVFLNKFVNSNYDLKFTGFIAQLMYLNPVPQLIVVFSVDGRIPLDAIIHKINNINALQFLQQHQEIFGKSTNSQITNLKKSALYISLLNPILKINNISISTQRHSHGQKDIVIKYIKNKRGYFQEYGDNIFMAFHKLLIGNKLDSLQLRKLDKANLLYLDLHEFPSYDKDMDILVKQMYLITEDLYEWIVLDLRNNFGGTLNILYILSYYLYGKEVSEQLLKCQQYTLANNEEMNQQYYDQVILPILVNQHLPKNIKKEIETIYYKSIKGSDEFKVQKPHHKQCNKDIISTIKHKLIKKILKNDYFKKVIIIVDNLCFSACLHTNKFLRQFPNVIAIGHQIGKTKLSGNSVSFDLPSGQGSVLLPQLFVQNQNAHIQQIIKEDNNEPDVFVNDDLIYDDEGLIIQILQNKQYFDQLFRKKAQHQKNTI